MKEAVPVFVTAHNVTTKDLNLAIASMQEYGFNDLDALVETVNKQDRFTIMESADQIIEEQELKSVQFPITRTESGFAGWDLAQIADWIIAREGKWKDMFVKLWLVVDEQCLEEQRVVLISKHFEDSDDEVDKEVLDREAGVGDAENRARRTVSDDENSSAMRFNFCRIPYEEARNMIINLNIGNMGFEEWVVDSPWVKAGWIYDWKPFTDYSKPEEREKQQELKKAADEKFHAIFKELEDREHVE